MQEVQNSQIILKKRTVGVKTLDDPDFQILKLTTIAYNAQKKM